MARDDVKTAKEYKAGTFDRKRVLEVSVVKWLREEGLITEEEEKAIEQARNRPPPDRKKIELATEQWIRDNLVAPLGVKGAWVHNHVNKCEQHWKAACPTDPKRPTDMGSRQRTYNNALDITSEAACLHVCQWLWKQHSRQHNVPCPWDFTGACE